MAEIIRGKPYWRQTKLLMASSLAVPLLLIGGIAYWIGRAGDVTLAGMPLGFFLATHGVVVVAIGAVARYAVIQDRIDRWHGANDDV